MLLDSRVTVETCDGAKLADVPLRAALLQWFLLSMPRMFMVGGEYSIRVDGETLFDSKAAREADDCRECSSSLGYVKCEGCDLEPR